MGKVRDLSSRQIHWCRDTDHDCSNRASLRTDITARKHLATQSVEKGNGSGYLKRSLGILEPGLITGAADDDPSGISTYSVAGAAYGYTTLWIALLTFPLMVAIQLMCARLGMVTGRGLAAAVRMCIVPAR